MKLTRPRVSLGAAAIAASLLLAACGSGSSTNSASTNTTAAASTSTTSTALTTVTVAYIPISLFEPLFVAMHNGYFAKHGIKVKLTVVPSGQSATTLAATNKVQVVLGGFSAGMFNAINQGLNFKVVGSMAEEASGTPANGLVVANSLETSGKVKSIADLKGMKIAVSGGAGSTGAYLVAEALKPYNLTLKDVTLVNLAFPEMESALKSGSVAAAFPPAPFLGAIVKDNVGTVLAGAPVGVAAVGVIYGGEFAKSPQAQGFFDALVEAAKQLQGSNANSTTNLSIVAKATGQKLSLLQSEPPNLFSPTLAPPTKTLSSMQNVFLASHNLDYTSAIPSSKYIDSTFSNNAS